MTDNGRKIVVHRAGDVDQLKIEPFELATPKPDEVVIEMAASGINYADVIVRMGLYSSAKKYVGWPITPGFEVAGVVRACGACVTRFKEGDRVFAVTRFGGYTTHLVVPEDQVFLLPGSLTMEQGAAFPAVNMTAWMALSFLAHPRPGDTVLVHSAAGGVGTCAVQMAKQAQCDVIGVVGASHKVALAKELGCREVIDTSQQDLWHRVEALAPEGFHVILDANGVKTLQDSYDHLRPAGKLVVYGFASMMSKNKGRPNYMKLAWDYLRTPRFNPLDLTTASKSILAFNLSYLFDRMDLLQVAMADVLEGFAKGALVPPPVTTYTLDDVAKAHEDLQSGQTTGKLVLVP